MAIDWHISDLTALEKRLGSNLSEGLSAREARVRLEKEYKAQKGKRRSFFTPAKSSILGALFSYVLSPFFLLLLIVSLATACFGGWLEGISAFLITLAAALFGGFLRYSATHRIEAMQEFASPMVRVKRGGNFFHTDGRNLVKGDVIYLSAGDLLPCDARIVKCRALKVDELYFNGRTIAKRSIEKTSEAFAPAAKVALADASNMLFAGTAITEGNAIAVVCATGEELLLTPYLAEGALGGKDVEPEGIHKLRPKVQLITLISGAALLVLSLLGLVTLRKVLPIVQVFILLLAAMLFLTGELLSHGVAETAAAYMRRLLKGKGKKKQDRTAAVRNIKAFDTLSGITDLVILGKAGLTEGAWRIAGVYTAGGTKKMLTPETPEGNRILSLIHIYLKALRNAGQRNDLFSDGYADALSGHLRASGFDINAADLEIQSLYLSGDSKYGFACSESEYRIDRVALTFDDHVPTDCKRIRDGEKNRELYNDDRQNILLFRANAVSKGMKCLYLISEEGQVPVFEGIIAMTRPVDHNLLDATEGLSRMGINTTVLLPNEDAETAKLIAQPSLATLFAGKIAMASEFHKTGKSIETGIGSYTVYIGFENYEYERLIEKMRDFGASVAAYGVDNRFNSVMATANVAISCDALNYASEHYREAVYEKLPPEGRDTNLRASQQTRLLSKVIVKRAHENGGGLTAILEAMRLSRSAYISFTQTMLLFLFLMSGLIPFTVLSVVTGTLFLDPLQTLALSAVFALMSVTLFTDSKQKQSLIEKGKGFIAYPARALSRRLPSVIARASVALVVSVAVKIMDVLGVFGERAAYTLPIYVCLLLTSFAEVFLLNLEYTEKGQGRRACWMKVIFAYALLLCFSAVSTQQPFASLYFANGFGTREFLIVPGYLVLYAIALFVAHLVEKTRKN